MKIALVQTTLFWENAEANRENIEKLLSNLDAEIKLIILPEMFSSGFSMQPEKTAETMEGQTISWMKAIAKARNSALMGSLAIKDGNNFFNRLVFVFPSGEISIYDKRHLFSFAGENQKYSPGQKRISIEYLGWKICPLICYDLRFPVFSRNTDNYNLLIYVANWPKSRANAWNILLKARAVENICYTIGVNRTGFDGNQLEYNGQSQIIDPLGEYVVAPSDASAVFVTELSLEIQRETVAKYKFLDDRDQFEIQF